MIVLDKKTRNATLKLDQNKQYFALAASRSNCRDILIEMVQENGNAKSQPLSKLLDNKTKRGAIIMLRFIMNNQSVQPIEIKVKQT